MNEEVLFIEQVYDKYTAEDHDVWKILFSRQTEMVKNIASSEYQRGIKLLDLDSDRIPELSALNQKLEEKSGWVLMPVAGLVSNYDFFYLISNKVFPINIHIRRVDELDFAELPDIFHDIFGHVPMLINPLFTDFMIRFSRISLKYIHDERAIAYFGRLYWFTLETGLIKENGEIKAYGGAIITSSGEIANVYKGTVPLKPFNLNTLLETSFEYLKMQREYFLIDSYAQLFDSLDNLEEQLTQLAG